MATENKQPAVAGDSSSAAEQVKPYKIHVCIYHEHLYNVPYKSLFGPVTDVLFPLIQVSSRYLNLTKQKLEIARLPHELDKPKSKDWWQPKSQVEPLIDFWYVTPHPSGLACVYLSVHQSLRIILSTPS